ncbi:MAG: hypothetical protein R3B09_08860 [Nannocystaceae bacterium]
MRRLLGALALALTASVAGCLSTRAPTGCDPDALLAVTEALEREASAPGAEMRAIRGLFAACPKLPSGHGWTFSFRYDPERRMDLGPTQMWSDKFLEEQWSSCTDLEAYQVAPTLPGSERPPLFYEACGVARFGVLDEGERFLGDDKDTFFLLAALEREGADRALLRRLGRALMNSAAPLPVALRRCNVFRRRDDDACERLLDLHRIDLPSTRDSGCSWDGDLRIFIAPDAVRWDGEVVARIKDGAIAPEDVVHHRISALTPRIEAWAKDPPLDPTSSPKDEPVARLLIAADAEVPIGVLHEVLHTATRAGVKDLALVADLHKTLPVQRPRGLVPVGPIVLDARGVHIPSDGTRTVPIDAGEAISTFARDARSLFPNDGVLVRATPTVPVADALRVLSAVDPDCRGVELERATTLLDQEPPIPPRPGRWDDVEARIGSIELAPHAPRSLTHTGLRAQLEPRLRDLSECLRENKVMRAVMPEHLWIRYATRDGETVAEFEFEFKSWDDSSYTLSVCIDESLGLRRPSEHIVEGDAVVRLDLHLPLEDAPPPPAGSAGADPPR